MLWEWLFEAWSAPFGTLKIYLRHHPAWALRSLLFGGDVLLLAAVAYLLQVAQPHQGYYAWLAGLAATLGILFVFTIISALMNGYQRYRDTWLGVATGIMLLLSAVLAVVAVYHAA